MAVSLGRWRLDPLVASRSDPCSRGSAERASAHAGTVEQKYEVQSVQLVCTWRFGAGFNDTCYIDKTSLYEQSLDGQANNIEDQQHDSWFISTGARRRLFSWPRPATLPLTRASGVGECNHSFHTDNIKKFIARGRAVCPVCNQPWVEKSIVPLNQMLGTQ